MNSKRIGKWLIVLFLLAALPGMTAVVAQGQEPAKYLPVVTEAGESAAPEVWNVYESEPNNTLAAADWVVMNDVVGGEISSVGDKDFFKFNMPSYNGGLLLLDIEAESIGSSLDAYICLYKVDGTVLTCSDDTDTLDSLIFRAVWGSGGSGGNYPYYVSVEELGNNAGGANYDYELIVSTPLIISAAAQNLGTGYVAGIPFRSEDVLAHSDLNTGAQKWIMLFDGSDVGITKNVTNLGSYWAWQRGSLLLSLAADLNVPGAGLVTPWDVIEFTGQFGPATSGTFSMYLDGSAWGLTTAGEKIDAFGGWAWGYNYNTCLGFPISTVGAATVTRGATTLKFADEDVFCMEEYNGLLGWRSYFDGSMASGLAAEDVIATSVVDYTNRVYLTIAGTGKVAGHKVNQKDIFSLNYPGYSWGAYVWRGPAHGWNYNIDAFEYKGW